MSYLPFRKGEFVSRKLKFADVTQGLYLVFPQAPFEVLRLWIHFCDGFSLPCTGDECENCHIDKRPYAYPVVLLNVEQVTRGAQAEFGVLGVPHGAMAFLDTDRRNKIYHVSRKRNQKTGQLIFREQGAIKVPALVLPNVEENLERLWRARNDRVQASEHWEHMSSASDRQADRENT